MKKIFLTIFILIVGFVMLYSQDGNLGIFLGGSYYQGEVNPNKPLYMPSPVIGLFYRHNFNMHWAFRIEGNYTVLRGSDSKSDNVYQQARNYAFTTRLGDLGAGMEFNFLQYDKHEYSQFYYTPYVFLGAMILVIPDPKYPFEFSFPTGIGFKYGLTRKVTLALEWSYRWTYSDRLDGLREDDFTHKPYEIQHSYNPDKDVYSFVGISLSYELFKNTQECPAIFR